MKKANPVKIVKKSEVISLNDAIRQIRLERKISGVELCRKAGDLDPRTLVAVEKGRIKNPSVQTLSSIARGLGVSISELFRKSELSQEQYFYQGNQKGAFEVAYHRSGVKLVSFTPFISDFFCGKLIIEAKRSFDHSLLKHPHPFYFSCLVGRLDVDLDDKKVTLKEGENLFFHGSFPYRIHNELQKDATLLVITAPGLVRPAT